MILNDEHIDTNKVNGVGESTLNKIKNKVIENFQLFDLVEEYSDYGMTIQMMHKLYEHYNKSAAKVKEKMEEDTYY